MQIRRDCFLPALSARPPQKNAPTIIPRYTMLPATHGKQRHASETGREWSWAANKQGTEHSPAFCMGTFFFKNISFRTHKSAFKLETKLCGLPSAAVTTGKSKSWSHQPRGDGYPVGRQNESPHRAMLEFGSWAHHLWSECLAYHHDKAKDWVKGSQSGLPSLLPISVYSKWPGPRPAP